MDEKSMTTPSQEFPQRRSILKSENSLGACRAVLSGAVVQADKDKYFDLISLAEHESILAERILYGYEWCCKEVEKKDREITELKEQIQSDAVRILLKRKIERIESRAQKLVEALDFYAEAFDKKLSGGGMGQFTPFLVDRGARAKAARDEWKAGK